jgi:signal transduction histidine kinase
MMKRGASLLLGLCLSACALMAQATPTSLPLLLSSTAEKSPLAGHLSMWLDTSGTATWQQARTQTFAPVEGNINLGYKPGVLWVRMQVQLGEKINTRPALPDWGLEVSPASLDEITLWVEPSTRAHRTQAVVEPLPQQAGAAVHPDQRPMWHRHSVFLIDLPAVGTYTLLMRVKTSGIQMVVPVLWQIGALEKSAQLNTMTAGIFYGILVCITLTALILGLNFSTPLFLLCAGYFFFLSLTLFVAEGWLGLLLFPGRPMAAVMLSSSSVALLIPLFVSLFAQLMRVNQTLPRLALWYLRAIWLVGLLAILMLLSPYFALVAPVLNILAIVQLSLIFVLALWVGRREPTLRWVLLALLPILLPSLLHLAQRAGVDFFENYLDTWLLVGITLHGLILLLFVARIVGRTYKSNLTAQAQIIASAAQLDEQRDFVALLSHEFRNPISVLGSALSNLSRQQLNADTSSRLGRMARAVARLEYVLGYCLADERMNTSDSAQHTRHRLAPSDIVEEGLQQLNDESKRLQLMAIDPVSLPLMAGVRVLGNLQLLGAALKNLLDNALKYAESGPVQLSIHVQATQVTFTVRDYGTGLDDQARGRLFEKFTRGQQHAKTPGAGLGLHLARKIVRQHGGEICVLNASGGGAVAELTLPLIAN